MIYLSCFIVGGFAGFCVGWMRGVLVTYEKNACSICKMLDNAEARPRDV